MNVRSLHPPIGDRRYRRLLTLLTAAAMLAAAAPASATGEFTLEGRGNGHGIGMSQYGAQSQALEGRSDAEILRTYYKGTSLAQRSVGFDPVIGVALDETRIRVVVRGAPATIVLGNQTLTAETNSIWTTTVSGNGACTTVKHPSTSYDGCPVLDPSAGGRIEVRTPVGTDAWHIHNAYGRDSVVSVIPDEVKSATWRLDVVVELPLEQYLYGLAEMPYSWEPAALRAQAVAGRSYALYRLLELGDSAERLEKRGCSCHLYDSQQDQVYAGWDREQSELWTRWKAAVDGTAATVVSYPPKGSGTRDGVVQAFYSSSSNGRTEAKHELWGGTVYPYLVSVDDRWSLSSINPYRSWSIGLADGSVASKIGMDTVFKVEVTERSTSGAATEVRFTGRDGGKESTATRTGSWVRSMFGLRSTTIEYVYLPPFTDDDGNPHEGDIVWLADRAITRGCNDAGNKFCPDAPVKRGEMAAFLVRALDLPAGKATFTDTKGTMFEQAISALARAGITEGCNPPDNTRFCPDSAVTRAEMATFLTRALSLANGKGGQFTDTAGNVHQRGIDALAAAGITQGCNPPRNTRYCPGSPVTRAQMATFLHRGLS